MSVCVCVCKYIENFSLKNKTIIFLVEEMKDINSSLNNRRHDDILNFFNFLPNNVQILWIHF